MVKVTNLTDLDGQEMTSGFEIGTPAAGSSYVGWMMFKVKADGDVTIQGDVDGWINIDQIQLYAPGIVGTTDLLLRKRVMCSHQLIMNTCFKDVLFNPYLRTSREPYILAGVFVQLWISAKHRVT
jgi:hypothetical protein